jgi:deoxycytidine triphosphate deaminase
MVLSNLDIQRALAAGRLGIVPPPPATAFESNGVNLTLAPRLLVVQQGGVTFDPALERITDVLRGNTKEVILTDDEPFVLEPGVCLLAMTAERITLPADEVTSGELPLMGLIEGRSTLGRCFMTVHVTAPFINNGTDHAIALEIVNLGQWNIVLRKGMNIAQMTFLELSGQPRVRQSQFHGQTDGSGQREAA